MQQHAKSIFSFIKQNYNCMSSPLQQLMPIIIGIAKTGGTTTRHQLLFSLSTGLQFSEWK